MDGSEMKTDRVESTLAAGVRYDGGREGIGGGVG